MERGGPAVCNVSFNREGKDEMGVADNAESLAGCESLHRQLPVFGRLAYPERAEATKHDVLGWALGGLLGRLATGLIKPAHTQVTAQEAMLSANQEWQGWIRTE